VARLLRAAGLGGRRPRRWKPTTIPDPAATARADLIRRDVTVNAAAVNTRWCGDITYIPAVSAFGEAVRAADSLS
jgi:transposase InsO family protein